MIRHKDITRYELSNQITNGKITVGGNIRLKIYGALNCHSGKRMKKEHRVFFKNENEAIINGYRPCGNCMSVAFKDWKMSKKQVENLQN